MHHELKCLQFVPTKGESPFNIASIKLSSILGIDDDAQLRFSILNKDEIPDEVSVEGKCDSCYLPVQKQHSASSLFASVKGAMEFSI